LARSPELAAVRCLTRFRDGRRDPEVELEHTGERPMAGATPDSLLALHDAGYREVLGRLGPGVVVDVGCGVGDETERLAAPDRFVIGVDYSSGAVQLASKTHRAGTRSGDSGTLAFVASDGARLGLRDGSVDFVVSSHIIEHFVNPALHVIELARVLRTDGTALVITPNAPADFENPFHVYMFEEQHLVSLLSLFFDDVTCLGIDGDDVLKADFAARRATGHKLLKLDRFDLRHKIPYKSYVWAYEHILPLTYKLLGRDASGIGSGIDSSHFDLRDDVQPDTPVLFAIARRPRIPVRPT
jgi:ubiquinone/menaquinone biosynthesis C-methylase UbiE